MDESSPRESPADISLAREVGLGALLDRGPTGVVVLDADNLLLLEANAAARRVFDSAV